MLRVALDTNAYRALDDENLNVIKLVSQASVIGLPVTVIGELYFGIFDGHKKEQNLINLQKFMSVDRIEILNINTQTAKLYGEISTELKRQGKPTQQNDIWIAALCKQHDFTLITSDKGFNAIIGLETINF